MTTFTCFEIQKNQNTWSQHFVNYCKINHDIIYLLSHPKYIKPTFQFAIIYCRINHDNIFTSRHSKHNKTTLSNLLLSKYRYTDFL